MIIAERDLGVPTIRYTFKYSALGVLASFAASLVDCEARVDRNSAYQSGRTTTYPILVVPPVVFGRFS